MPEHIARQVPPLPATRADLDTHLTYKRGRTLIDKVQEYNALLWEEPEYQKYLAAGFDEQSVTGRTDFDDYEAAKLIQAKAHERGDESVANEKTSAVVKALRRVLGGRYEGVSRRDRREAAEGNGQGNEEGRT